MFNLMDVAVYAPQPARPEILRRVGWEIGEEQASDWFTPVESHLALVMVSPAEGFIHWRLQPGWVDECARQRGAGWRDSRLIARLYNVSYIAFDGMNAHEMRDFSLSSLCGQMFLKLSRPGTWQIAEIGFLLRSGEFIPAVRSRAVSFPRDAAATQVSRTGLLVTDRGIEAEVDNVWDCEKILRERCRPRARSRLRIANLAFADAGGCPPRFLAELASVQAAQGHEVHLFVGGSAPPSNGVHYHAVDVPHDNCPLEMARAFARAVETSLGEMPPFDVVHMHDWMAGLVSRPGQGPSILSLSSIEAGRRNGTPPSDISLAIEQQEREAVQKASLVLTPPWLRDQAIGQFGLNEERVRPFPLEGRMPNAWESPLDLGAVKREIGLGPLDRLLVYVGPLEHAAGVDVLVEALPTLLQRCGNLRVACVGAGNMHNALAQRAQQLGVGHALRLLGHVEGPLVPRLLRAAMALVLPSRYRVPFDDEVVQLARCAARPVITTHSGPAHLVRHEENGLITYDNPGSIVWAVDRLVGNADHAERMGHAGRSNTDATLSWEEVGRHYLQLCVEVFPELTSVYLPGESR